MEEQDIVETGDDTLASRAAAGEACAFDELHRRYAPFVHAILLSRLPYSECEDVAQEVFAAAFQSILRLREPGQIGPWLAAIARNLAAGHYRRQRGKRVGLETLDREAAGRADAGRSELGGTFLLEEIRKLPEAYRETLTLRFVEGFTGPEIAEKTGLTHGSVRVNLSRGIEMLRERLSIEKGGKKHE